MYESFFSYKLERSYPFKWFTWVAVIGGIILTAIFSAFNVATNGYDTSIVYTTDLNGTMAQKFWFDSPFFSWTNRPSSKCEPANIQVGQTTTYTSNLLAAYTLHAVSIENNGTKTPVPSLTYGNEILQNCSMDQISLWLEGLTDRDALSFARTRWNARVGSGGIKCAVVRDGTVSTITLSIVLDPTTPSFLTDVYEKRNSPLWWSWAMFSWYLIESLSTFQNVTSASTDEMLKGFARFYVNSSEPDINSEYFLFAQEGFFYLNDISGKDRRVFANKLSIPDWAQQPALYGNISFSINNYIKSFYTLIMTDLGSSKPTLVSNAEALRSYTKNFRPGPYYGMFKPLETESFESYTKNSQTEGLAIQPSTLYAQYICQVPKLKSWGSVLAAVVLADLVFLSAAWTVLNWGTLWWLRRTDSMAMLCKGCAQASQAQAQFADTDLGGAKSTGVDVHTRTSYDSLSKSRFGDSTYELLQREVR